jgi:hypothetical protein
MMGKKLTKELYESLKKQGTIYPDGKLCFCQMAIGNPMVSSHSWICEISRSAIAEYENSKNG